MKVILTGASGMLGRAIRNELMGKHEIIELSLSGNEETIKCDLRDEIKVSEIITEHQPELVIHTAAVTDVDFCESHPRYAHEVNAAGTRNIVWSISELKRNIIFIQISTDYVFNGEKKSPYTEDDTPHPLNVYGMSKLSAEHDVSYFIEKYFILRTGLLYGEGDNFVKNLFDKFKDNKEVFLFREQILSPTSTSDFAKAVSVFMDKIIELPKGNHVHFGIYNLVNSGEASRYQLAAKIAGYLGVSADKIKALSRDKLAPRPKYCALSVRKFQEFTGIDINSWEEALSRYLRKL